MEIRESLATAKEVELFSAGSAGSNHAPYVFKRHFSVPSVFEAGWEQALESIISREGITHVFPAHDDALLGLLEAAKDGPGRFAKVVSSPLATCRVARSKSLTARAVAGHVPSPRIHADPSQIDRFPVFLKPDRGQGSQRADVAPTPEHLSALLTIDRDRLIFDYLPGPEYTIDCFSDRERGLLYARGRVRTRVRAGIAMASHFVDDPRFEQFARKLASLFQFHGAWFFQLKEDESGTLNLLEFAPRVGGASTLSRISGVNLPLLSLYEADRIPVQPVPSGFGVDLDRALRNRYSLKLKFRRLYVDLDDTLITHGRTNGQVVRLLHQAVDQGCEVILVTRHTGDLHATLARHRLQSLFDQVHLVPPGCSKVSYMNAHPEGSIFIDDSFRERSEVTAQLGIPSFDPSMIEALIDDRV